MKTVMLFAVMAIAVWSAQVTPVTEARTVKYGSNDVVPVTCAQGYNTMIVLKYEEKIVKALVGDADNWVADGWGTNAVSMRPTTRAASTNLTLVGRSGRNYVFLLNVANAPDLMVYVEPSAAGDSGVYQAKQLYTEDEVAVYRKQVDAMAAQVQKIQASVDIVRSDAERKLAVAKADLPKQIRHPYKFEQDKAPFNIRDIYVLDGKFTHIEAAPNEVAAVFEVVDDKPKVVNYVYEDGVYKIDKVVRNGHLAIGKKKSAFYMR